MMHREFIKYKATVIQYPLNITSNWTHDFSQLSSTEATWLLDSSSLTAKLKETYNQFSVQVLNESLLSLNQEQAIILGSAVQQVLCREVLLIGDGQARIYAQSWIPLAAIEQNSELSNLGSKPLGEYIFKHPELCRHDFEITKFDQNSAVSTLLLEHDFNLEPVWSRRSVFSLHGFKLMVSETFLPGVF